MRPRPRELALIFLVGAAIGLMLFCATDSRAALPATFDGASWQDAAPCDALADTTYTVCARVTNAAAPSTASRAAYSAASGTLSDQYAYLGVNNNLLPECTYRSSTSYSAKAPTAIGSGEHTIFCVADGTFLSLYVDGVFRAAVTITAAQPSPRGFCTVGALRRSSGASNYWQGEIAAVQVWDRAMTAAEVAMGCAEPPPPTVEPCHGHTALRWDPHPDPTVAYFAVDRAIFGGAWMLVGDTAYKNRPEYIGEDGTIHPAVRGETWDLLRAYTVPSEGVVYGYRVRAIRGDGATSDPSNVVTCGPQDPTTCYYGGAEVDCADMAP